MEFVLGIATLGWATYGCMLVGGLYWFCSYRPASVGRRLLAAAYAPSAALLFLVAALAPQTMWPRHFPIFLLLQLVPLVLFAVSLQAFTGPRWVHWLLGPVALLCVLWQAALGHIAIHGK